MGKHADFARIMNKIHSINLKKKELKWYEFKKRKALNKEIQEWWNICPKRFG
jgi:hypothetical protein